jgi:hypothetical protein
MIQKTMVVGNGWKKKEKRFVMIETQPSCASFLHQKKNNRMIMPYKATKHSRSAKVDILSST